MPSHSVSKWTRVAAALIALSAGCGSSNSSIDDSAGSNGPSGDATTGATSTTASDGSAATDTGATSTTSATSTATTGGSTAAGVTTSGGTGVGGSDDTTVSTLTTNSASGGAGGTAGSAAGGSAGSGGTSTETCPAEPPSAESVCTVSGQMCAYEDCAGEGRSIARCSNGAWTVESSTCGDSIGCQYSGAGMCDSGNICLVLAGGAIFGDCVPNTCDTGPVSWDCIEGCAGTCSVSGDPSYGITIMCNTCPSGLCP